MKAENKARASLVYKTAGMPTKDSMIIDNAMHYPCHVTALGHIERKILHHF
ncbi:hypothetical protein ANAPC1_00270 [Anaplasma phagocytophilum]|uniref:Uncharacterized protein n=1 Tax=Anaplasma phagocytophilum TaxID=948 RepID=A0AA45ZH46_ANAPH|nr:hypothetical protein [Anaplasma phagocytophilum]SBO13930.1 hypothetical protein ANAPC1_00270 [Anaplasma phagocytophilum]SBO33786.1 hypothetical protein ANAPC4_01293 [Anaplasma phagocytophilum]SCV66615.1 hypothetical protein ANAPRD1_01168 [Anaplasma phagocytophilum]